jgi:hypothetical protein
MLPSLMISPMAGSHTPMQTGGLSITTLHSMKLAGSDRLMVETSSSRLGSKLGYHQGGLSTQVMMVEPSTITPHQVKRAGRDHHHHLPLKLFLAVGSNMLAKSTKDDRTGTTRRRTERFGKSRSIFRKDGQL